MVNECEVPHLEELSSDAHTWEFCEGGNGIDDWESSGDVYGPDGEPLMEDYEWVNLPEEEEEPSEPEEGDWVTKDYHEFTQHQYPNAHRDRVILNDEDNWREALKAIMEVDQFWPNVWHLSDHGNWLLLSLEEEKPTTYEWNAPPQNTTTI